MKCVAEDQCGCYAEMLRYEIGQSVPAKNNCQTWYVYYYSLLSSSRQNVATGQYNDTSIMVY